MPDRRPVLARADLPAEFTPETIKDLPIGTLRRLADHRNGILSRDEQRAFDKAAHELFRGMAERVRSGADWSTIRRHEGARTGRPSSRTDQQLQRIAQRIGKQVDLAETLAPDVDWSFTQPDPAAPGLVAPRDTPETLKTPETPETPESSDDQAGTVSDLEQRITEQVELVEVMSEIAEMSKRTYALEQQRDLQTTRTVFFGFVVSVAVLVAGWAPLVAADWDQRISIIALTLATCLAAGLVYALVRSRQNRSVEDPDDGG